MIARTDRTGPATAPRRGAWRGGDERGVTIIELMVALSVTLIGFAGLLSMQTGSLQGASEARKSFLALQLADHFGETLRTEAVHWIEGSDLTAGDFPRLQFAPSPSTAGTQSAWLVETIRGLVGPLGDVDDTVGTNCDIGLCDEGVLNEIDKDDDLFCIHYRLTWLISDALLRADVRILWIRTGKPQLAAYADDCDWNGTASPPGADGVMAADMENVHYISFPVTLSVNTNVAGE